MLALLKAEGKLHMIERDGDDWIHIPPDSCHSVLAATRYLLSCMPGQEIREDHFEVLYCVADMARKTLHTARDTDAAIGGD